MAVIFPSVQIIDGTVYRGLPDGWIIDPRKIRREPTEIIREVDVTIVEEQECQTKILSSGETSGSTRST